MLAASVEASRAARLARFDSRFRDRGGVFVPSASNELLEKLLARGVNGESPSKPRLSPRRAAPQAESSLAGPSKGRPRKSVAAAKSEAKAKTNVKAKAKAKAKTTKDPPDAVAGIEREDSPAENVENEAAGTKKKSTSRQTTKASTHQHDPGIQAPKSTKTASRKRARIVYAGNDSDDEPVVKKRATAVKSRAKKTAKSAVADDADDADAAPQPKPKLKPRQVQTTRKPVPVVEDASDPEDAAEKKPKPKRPPQRKGTAKSKELVDEPEESTSKKPSKGKTKAAREVIVLDDGDKDDDIPARTSKAERATVVEKPSTSHKSTTSKKPTTTSRKPTAASKRKLKVASKVDPEPTHRPNNTAKLPMPTSDSESDIHLAMVKAKIKGKPVVVRPNVLTIADEVESRKASSGRSSAAPAADDEEQQTGVSLKRKPKELPKNVIRKNIVVSDEDETTQLSEALMQSDTAKERKASPVPKLRKVRTDAADEHRETEEPEPPATKSDSKAKSRTQDQRSGRKRVVDDALAEGVTPHDGLPKPEPPSKVRTKDSTVPVSGDAEPTHNVRSTISSAQDAKPRAGKSVSKRGLPDEEVEAPAKRPRVTAHAERVHEDILVEVHSGADQSKAGEIATAKGRLKENQGLATKSVAKKYKRKPKPRLSMFPTTAPVDDGEDDPINFLS